MSDSKPETAQEVFDFVVRHLLKQGKPPPSLAALKEHVDLLLELQEIHDYSTSSTSSDPVAEWLPQLRRLAGAYGLNASVLD